MILWLLGDLPDGGLPFLDDQFTQIAVRYPGNIEIPEDFPCGVTVVTEDAKLVPDHVLDFAAEVIEAPDPHLFMSLSAQSDDMVFMNWDESDEMYRYLLNFNKREIPVYDMETFELLEIGNTPDFETLVASIIDRVTKEVLRVVREEMQDAPRTRRARPAAKRV